jgi:hypothetical protein
MKRKAGKKLSLNRETLVRLEDGPLAGVQGGFSLRCTNGPACNSDTTGDGTSNMFSCDATICGCESHFCTSGQTCFCV